MRGRQWNAAKNACAVASRHSVETGDSEFAHESNLYLVDVLVGEGRNDEALELWYVYNIFFNLFLIDDFCSLKTMEEGQVSKHVFHTFHTLHSSRLQIRLGSIFAAAATRISNSNSKLSSDARSNFESASRSLVSCLRSLGFDASVRAGQKRQNVFLPAVTLLAQVQVKLAQVTNMEMVEAIKREVFLNQEKVISVLDSYRAVCTILSF